LPLGERAPKHGKELISEKRNEIKNIKEKADGDLNHEIVSRVVGGGEGIIMGEKNRPTYTQSRIRRW
jgi:hypothetical protein